MMNHHKQNLSPQIDDTRSSTSSDRSEPEVPAEAYALPAAEAQVDENLPPIDGGRAAWSVIFGAWFSEGLLWGLPLSYGIFQSYYYHNPPFEGNKTLPIVGNLATGVSSLMLPVVSPLVIKHPRYQLHIMWTGWAMCIVGLLGASIATQAWHLMLFQGIIYGQGWVMCYTPMLLITNGWFIARRGLVYGILFGASGVTNIFLPFVLETLLQKYDFRGALRLSALSVMIISGPPLLLVRPRTKALPKATPAALDYSFLKLKRFYAFAFCVAFQGIGFFWPHIFLPSFAHSLELSQNQGAALVAIYSFCQVSGQMTIGHFSDKVDVHIPLAMSPFLSGIAVMLLWGPAKAFVPLALFAMIYGFFGASFSVMWSRVSMYLTDDPGTATTIFGMFSLVRGLLNVLAGPLSAVQLGDEVVIDRYGLGKYKKVVLFVGCCMLISSTIGLGWFWRKKRDQAGNGIHGNQSGAYELISEQPMVVDGILKQSSAESSSAANFETEHLRDKAMAP